jgi:hypothetical protein
VLLEVFEDVFELVLLDVFEDVLELVLLDVFDDVFELVLLDVFEDVLELVLLDVFEDVFEDVLLDEFEATRNAPASWTTDGFSASMPVYTAACAPAAPAARTATDARVEMVIFFMRKVSVKRDRKGAAAVTTGMRFGYSRGGSVETDRGNGAGCPD